MCIWKIILDYSQWVFIEITSMVIKVSTHYPQKGNKIYHIYPECLDKEASANSIDPDHMLQLIGMYTVGHSTSKFLDTSTDSKKWS